MLPYTINIRQLTIKVKHQYVNERLVAMATLGWLDLGLCY